MNNRKTYFITLIVALCTTLACTLTSEVPPTLAPITPASTITPVGQITAPTLQPQNVAPPAGVTQSQPQTRTATSSVAQVNVNRMLQDVTTLVNFQSRHVLSTTGASTGIQAAQNFLLEELRAIAATSPNEYLQIDVYPHQFQLEWGGQEVFPANVVMAIQGTDASAGVVMVTAHYDTTLQQWFDGDSYQPGANDNASGVAALLELARVLVQKPHRATLVFVFFSAEETGRQGSQAFVREFIQAQNIPLVAVMNMDMLATTRGPNGEIYDSSMRVFSEGPNATSPSRQVARMVHVAAGRYVPSISVEVEDAVDRNGRWGDHMSFSDVGYPAVRLIESADDRTVAHTVRDDVDRFDANYYLRTVQVALAATEMLADGPNPPTLRAMSPAGNDPNNLTLEWSRNPVCISYVVALRRVDSLVYNEFYTVESTSLSWSGFRNFETVSVACVDQEGRLGRFAPELFIPTS